MSRQQAPAVAARSALTAEREAVRTATAADLPVLARSLASAFYDDPVLGEWCCADAERRARRLERGFLLFLRAVYMPKRECYTTPAAVGGALWMPPGEWRQSAMSQLRLVPGLVRALGLALPRLLRLMGLTAARHPPQPHYYLAIIGVDPSAQSQGVGTALMTPVLDRCDRERLPAYLEATSPRNRSLYERRGFVVRDELRLPGRGPTLWLMWREPR